jgi:hypothetical protein
MTFGQLAIGDFFVFERSIPCPNIKNGVAKKISRGKYIYPDDGGIHKGLVYQVGTTKTEVARISK